MQPVVHLSIYALACQAGVVHYVGVAVNPAARHRGHITETIRHMAGKAHEKTTAKHYWINSLLEAGTEPELIILEVCDSLLAAEREIYWHEHYAKLAELYTLNPRNSWGCRYKQGKSVLNNAAYHIR